MSVDPLVQIYDVIGLGFGPSNIAVAGAFIENQSHSPISIDKLLFIEKQNEFKWHPAMLLPGAKMQISFLKDLATLRSPQSPLTFISYLHSQNRLLDFINRGRTIPTRKEYSDYLSWAAQYVQDKGVKVTFGEQVIALEEMDRFVVRVHSRVLSTGQRIVRQARCVIVSPGGSPRIPGPLEMAWVQERMIHSSAYLTSVAPLLSSLQSRDRDDVPLRIAVIGAGQSAAEIVIDLHSRLATIPVIGNKSHTLDLIIRKGSLKASDDSPFVNEIFNPETTNEFFRLPSHAAKQKVRSEFASTNYGVVNHHTLELLYEILYDQKLDDEISKRTDRIMPPTKPKLAILNHSEILSMETTRTSNSEGTDPMILALQHSLTREIYERTYDAIFCATGYERRSWVRLLTNSRLGRHFGLDEVAEDSIHLEVVDDLQKDVVDGDGSSSFRTAESNRHGNSPNTSASSGSNTPTSLDWESDWSCGERPTKKLYISRAYRLLPIDNHEQEKLEARIYVQGLAEETHGLSDTLLSVMSIRAGEVVDDLCKHFKSNGDVTNISHSDVKLVAEETLL